MASKLSRRQFVAVPGLGVASALLAGIPVRAIAQEPISTGESNPWPGFPRQDLKLVREIVGASHRDESRVRELVELKPALVNAWWDWGFGDWESPLGAAAHTGRRSIAEFLIERGARIDIFAAAMLGMTDVVRAFVAASPGVQRTLGPHAIPLLAHATAGDEKAKETAAYLESLGDAGNPPPVTALSEEQRRIYVGEYQFGSNRSDRLEVKLDDRARLVLVKGEEGSRQLHNVGNDEFFPAGVPSTRIRFDMKDGRAESLTVVERTPIITAARVQS